MIALPRASPRPLRLGRVRIAIAQLISVAINEAVHCILLDLGGGFSLSLASSRPCTP
jgi:hypothetical protein